MPAFETSLRRLTTIDLTDGKRVIVPDVDLTVWIDCQCEQDGEDTYFEIHSVEIDGKPVEDGPLLEAIKADIRAQLTEDFDEAIYDAYREDRYERTAYRNYRRREYA